MAKTIKLLSGHVCPTFGLGTYLSKDPVKLVDAVKTAIKSGYRHIDTAFMYMNEGVIGQALSELFAEGVVKRDEVFITTKLAPVFHEPQRVVPILKKQLEMLKLSYVDLYLIHSPVALQFSDKGPAVNPDGTLALNTTTTIEETWAAMESCVDQGLAKSVGLSNFNEKQVERIVKAARIKPVVNQVESHPYFQNTALFEFCKKHGINVMAYGPLGSAGSGKIQNLLEDERLIKIGQKYGKSSAQVALRWQVQRGTIVIPKSESPQRIIDNHNIWDFELSAEDMAAIAAMDTGKRAFTFEQFAGGKAHPEFPFADQL